jgi:hypothetical protein
VAEKKQKKEKPVYVDDGRTIADMSGVQGGASKYFQNNGPSYSSFKDKWTTFFDAFRMMLLPTLVVGGAMALLFGIMWLLFKLM